MGIPPPAASVALVISCTFSRTCENVSNLPRMHDQVMLEYIVLHVQCHQPAFHLVLDGVTETYMSLRHASSNNSKDAVSLMNLKASSA